jgi:hypothetical protein
MSLFIGIIYLRAFNLNAYRKVIEMYLESWQVEGESIPEPSTLQIA